MPTILLVDDDVTLIERLATLLGEAGYTVVRANQVQYGEMLLRERRPDLVLIDPDIGSGDGWVLLSAAAARGPVIVISGQGLEEDIVRGLDAGAADYLPKPFGSAELLARIRTRLREHERSGLAADAAPATSATMPLAPPPAEPAAPPQARRRAVLAPGDQDEPVFIPYGEEERLLREDRGASGADMSDIGQLPLGQRLHAARVRKRLTLVQSELETRPSVPMHYIQAMEEEKFSLLPRGPMAEELLRSYATFVGVDVASALDEYRRLHYIAPAEPIAGLGGAPAPRRIPGWLLGAVAALLAVAVGCGAIWAYDRAGAVALAQRIGALAAPPTSTPLPSSTPAPTAAPTSTPVPTSTATPTSTPPPTDTPVPTPAGTPTRTPRR
ncbi:response regulator [Kouleothrix sp.]|uniref:response regulator n=1 Tax=Kouleothrix sp. TaxID=2779161 RepID=UPI003919D3EE